MAYNKKDKFKQALAAIKENNLFFIDDIWPFIGIDRATLYRYFPAGSNEHKQLQMALDTNKIRTKSSIRARLYKSTNTGQQLALYRLICTPEERQMLNQSYIDVTTNGKDVKTEPITVEIIDSREQVDKPKEG